MLGKILGLLSIGSTLSTINLAEKFISIALTIVALTVLGSVIAGSLVMFGFYECYEILVRHGLDEDAAALFTCLLGVVTVVLIGTAIAYKLKKLHATPIGISRVENIAGEAFAALRGFYNGLTEKR